MDSFHFLAECQEIWGIRRFYGFFRSWRVFASGHPKIIDIDQLKIIINPLYMVKNYNFHEIWKKNTSILINELLNFS